ncbi:MAG: hypothetical protein ACLGHN_08215 [Bacteriovoracia bacterium]
MKKMLLALTVALSLPAAFAQTSVSANEVCSRVASISGINGSKCAQLIARNQFDPAALSLAYAAIPQSSSYAVRILEVTANGRLDYAAGEACEKVVAVSGLNGVRCAEVTVNKMISPDLARIAKAVVHQGSSYAVSSLEAGADAYFFGPLAEVCMAITSVSGMNTVNCVKTIANKVTNNGAEQVCRSAVSQGSSYAVRCLEGIVMDYTPVPQPTAVMVELYQLQDLRRSVLKARAQLRRGMFDQAERSLEEASQSIDFILNSQPNL